MASWTRAVRIEALARFVQSRQAAPCRLPPLQLPTLLDYTMKAMKEAVMPSVLGALSVYVEPRIFLLGIVSGFPWVLIGSALRRKRG